MCGGGISRGVKWKVGILWETPQAELVRVCKDKSHAGVGLKGISPKLFIKYDLDRVLIGFHYIVIYYYVFLYNL